MLVTKNTPNNKANRRRITQTEIILKNNIAKAQLPTQRQMADLMTIKETKHKRVENQSTLFFYIGLSITLGLLIILFNWNFKTDKGIVHLMGDQAVKFEEIKDIPMTVQPPPPPPKIIQAPLIIVVPDEVILDELDVKIDAEATEDMVIEEVIFDEAPMEEEKAEEIFFAVETPPAPKGGISAFYKFVGDNINYPNEARRAHVQGRIFVKFVVNKNGAIDDIVILKGIGYGCDEEALRVLKIVPNWKPGKQRGKPVRVYMSLPIIFQLAK